LVVGPPHVANRLCAMPAPLWTTKLGRSYLETLLAYKNPRVSSLRVPESTLSAAVGISAAAVNLPFRLLSGSTKLVNSFPNLHQSFHDHIWLSSTSHSAGNLAAAEAPRLLRRRPPPSRSPAKSPTPIEP
jgi:hypothetical protein